MCLKEAQTLKLKFKSTLIELFHCIIGSLKVRVNGQNKQTKGSDLREEVNEKIVIKLPCFIPLLTAVTLLYKTFFSQQLLPRNKTKQNKKQRSSP